MMIPKNIAALKYTQSIDATRYSLNGIHFEKSLAVSCDGHCLAVREFAAPKEIQGSNLNFGKKRLPNKMNSLDLNFIEGTNTAIDYETGIKAELEVDVDFPDWRQVAPTVPKKSCRIALNPYKLVALAEALGYDGRRDKESDSACSMVLEVELNEKATVEGTDETYDTYSGLSPIAVLLNDGKHEGVGVLMPQRLDDSPSPMIRLNKLKAAPKE